MTRRMARRKTRKVSGAALADKPRRQRKSMWSLGADAHHSSLLLLSADPSSRNDQPPTPQRSSPPRARGRGGTVCRTARATAGKARTRSRSTARPGAATGGASTPAATPSTACRRTASPSAGRASSAADTRRARRRRAGAGSGRSSSADLQLRSSLGISPSPFDSLSRSHPFVLLRIKHPRYLQVTAGLKVSFGSCLSALLQTQSQKTKDMQRPMRLSGRCR